MNTLTEEQRFNKIFEESDSDNSIEASIEEEPDSLEYLQSRYVSRYYNKLQEKTVYPDGMRSDYHRFDNDDIRIKSNISTYAVVTRVTYDGRPYRYNYHKGQDDICRAPNRFDDSGDKVAIPSGDPTRLISKILRYEEGISFLTPSCNIIEDLVFVAQDPLEVDGIDKEEELTHEVVMKFGTMITPPMLEVLVDYEICTGMRVLRKKITFDYDIEDYYGVHWCLTVSAFANHIGQYYYTVLGVLRGKLDCIASTSKELWQDNIYTWNDRRMMWGDIFNYYWCQVLEWRLLGDGEDDKLDDNGSLFQDLQVQKSVTHKPHYYNVLVHEHRQMKLLSKLVMLNKRAGALVEYDEEDYPTVNFISLIDPQATADD